MKRFLLIVPLLAILFSGPAAGQQERWAVVDVSSCFLRQKPDYESPLESQCLMGTVLKVGSADRYWRQVDAPDYKGCWTNQLAIAFMTDKEKDAFIAAPKLICLSEYSHIYASPSTYGGRICDFTMGCVVRRATAGQEENVPGWERVLTASGHEGWVLKYDVADFTGWAESKKAAVDEAQQKMDYSELQENIVGMAESLAGTPYMWGGSSIKYFDCSGLTKFVYLMNGIVLPRNAREQIATGVEVPYDIEKMLPGDLIFYGSLGPDGKPRTVAHVAMYIGGGRIIHSSQLVRTSSIRPGDPDYYSRAPIGVRRVLGCVDRGMGIVSVSLSPWYFKQQ